MKDLESIKSILKSNIPKFQDEYKVDHLKLFGSYLNNTATENSDLDILVSFSDTIDLIHFIKLQNYLSDLLNIKVDLVMENALKSRIKNSILQQAELI
ncbi:MAG: nucleotidyltransferase family protein [Candidatus Cloacimonetes bacterium]|nr:nucleotidyltransferase family protein [Candidatus Cloacimonadota bacterium]MCF7814647.1 nucleotidyltransferase family protein [Candidatus Cloacimonadota bacterium]MCF7869114.1 nucleotidyltransferase family protein [Candidatus Cloacimonadota bacterium]MCF7884523.1 nucleotidyltransferase family protein [Candidatus Cloacimonadota bacterium]